ncbi:DUF4915 domain-containing protein [Virgibacillus doumboii]|uniref:DUF4915 domain-containing protein n=1 Tax=Virgibacillus doumboii TaxID=2697503 RepID=UPI0013DF1B21|nr:DUF4915 domain-containing protein [Virgibacillus doumboii]
MKFFNLFNKIYNKKLIIFGAGLVGKNLIEEYDLPINYFVDNDQNKWGSKINNTPIYSPERLKRENKKDVAIIILSEAFEAISEQLESLGFNKNEHFWLNPDHENINQPIVDIKNINKSLLVTCFSTNGGLFLIDLKENNITKLVSGNFRGIIKTDNYLFVADEFEGIIQFDERINVIDHYKYDEVINTHGLAFDSVREILYVAESGKDRIGIFETNPLRRIDEISIGELGDGSHHINDLWIDEKKMYISMFSKIGRWRKGIFDSVVVELDLDSKYITNTLIEGLKQPHSVKLFNDKLYYLDSMNFNLGLNGNTIAEFNGFLRGLTYDGNYFYIGQSELKYLNRKPNNKNNVNIGCGIYIYDSNAEISRFVNVPATYIYDIILC